MPIYYRVPKQVRQTPSIAEVHTPQSNPFACGPATTSAYSACFCSLLSFALHPRPRESSPTNQPTPCTIRRLSQFHTVLALTPNSRATSPSALPSPIHNKPWAIL